MPPGASMAPRHSGDKGIRMQTEEKAPAGRPPSDPHPSVDREAALEAQEHAGVRLSPEGLELLERTLKVRRLIGKISMNVADLVHEMREQGGA